MSNRQITFGPNSYFESDQLRNDQNDNYNDDQNENLINHSTERIQSISQQRINEVIFYAGENLYRENMFGIKEIAIKKYCKVKFSFDQIRIYESYCFEFCGLLNLHMKDLKFFIGNKELSMHRNVRKPIEIDVYHSFYLNSHNIINNQVLQNSLKPAFNKLLEQGLYSDLDIEIQGQHIKAHQCILIARSEKFKGMLEVAMREKLEQKLVIQIPNVTFHIFKCMIQWMYKGECNLPTNINELIILLNLTDEYLLQDLQIVCEEQIIDMMDEEGSVEILTNQELIFPQASEKKIKDVAMQEMIENFEKIEEIYPDIEDRISQVKGLMSQLFRNKNKHESKGIRKRKNSMGISNDDNQKKKVRFNISNTIYEETSNIHDESDSFIEPLSIYSNDDFISSTHSSVYNSERRLSQQNANDNLRNQQNNQQAIVRFDSNQEYQNNIITSNQQNERLNRPSSARNQTIGIE